MRIFLSFFVVINFASNASTLYNEYSGYVAYGDKLGDLLNLKGANLHVRNLQERPGVYACRVDLPNLDRVHQKALCWIEEGPSAIIEAHILDFNENIYTQPIMIKLIQFIRTPQDFETLEECLVAIEHDKNIVRNLLE